MRKYHYILELAEDLDEEYHTFVMDRGYSTIALFEILMERKIYSVGTVKKYKNLPIEIRNAKPQKNSNRSGTRRMGQENDEDTNDDDEMRSINSEVSLDSERTLEPDEAKEDYLISVSAIPAVLVSAIPADDSSDMGLEKGQWIWMAKSINSDHNLICIAWHDSGICLAMSTRHSNAGSHVYRRVKGSAGRIKRSCPELIEFYNDFMGGVDRADALRSHLTSIRRCKKWWHALWHYIIDTAFMNSFILSTEAGIGAKDRSIFLHDLVCELIGDSAEHHRRKPVVSFDPPLPHYPAKDQGDRKKRRNCIVCYQVSSEEVRTM
jgi:hypothetical protein